MLPISTVVIAALGLWELVRWGVLGVSDISEEIRDILVFHLGCEEERLTDEARLIADLGADSLDIVEIMMSCEEKFGIDIPNLVATRLITVGDAVKCVTALVAGSAESGPMDPQPGMGLGQTP